MPTSDNIGYLKLPLYMLGNIDNVDEFEGLTKEQVDALPRHYSAHEVSAIKQALSFAHRTPGFDFKSLDPSLPHSNAQIHQFLSRVHTSIEQHAGQAE